jgi:hypothetical protein
MTLPFGENSISEAFKRRRLKGESKENLKRKRTRFVGMDTNGLTQDQRRDRHQDSARTNAKLELAKSTRTARIGLAMVVRAVFIAIENGADTVLGVG